LQGIVHFEITREKRKMKKEKKWKKKSDNKKGSGCAFCRIFVAAIA